MNPLPEGLADLAETFGRNGFRLYLVGGYVRNHLLGLGGADRDICSKALPGEAALFLSREGYGIIEKAPELGTIEIHARSGGRRVVFEHTTFRRDFYPEGGEHRPRGVEFTDSIEEDAARRDFTVNALYFDVQSGQILDPTKRGLKDLENRLIRAAAEDPDITIRDDGLRIMRMARFAAELGFGVDDSLFECAKRRAPLIRDISSERKRDELKKILMSDVRYPGFSPRLAPEYGLNILKDTGAIEFVLPMLSEGRGVAQSERYHKYDVLDHCIKTCAAAPAVYELRLAALLHDIGKPGALKESGNMYGHEKTGALAAKEELESLKADKKTIKTVLKLVENHMFDLEGNAKPAAIRRRAVKMGKTDFELLIALRRADCEGSGIVTGCKSADNWQRELERMQALRMPWSEAELEVSGNDVMRILGTGPSEKVGMILSRLLNECVADPSLNERARLEKRIAALAKTLR